jgi:hypothetical protein
MVGVNVEPSEVASRGLIGVGPSENDADEVLVGGGHVAPTPILAVRAEPILPARKVVLEGRSRCIGREDVGESDSSRALVQRG